jgi:hypothetical protein
MKNVYKILKYYKIKILVIFYMRSQSMKVKFRLPSHFPSYLLTNNWKNNKRFLWKYVLISLYILARLNRRL